MPPRLSNTRVTSVAAGRGGRPKPLNPGSSRAPNFQGVKAAIAKRQKISPDAADEKVRP